jgi:hypothetical protein
MTPPPSDRPATPGTTPLATFWLDVEYTRIAPAFAAGGIRTILLKGPAFDQMLFGGMRSRAYSDIDLLVDPGRVVAAGRLLGQLGFGREAAMRRLARRAGAAARLAGAAHGAAWIRERDGFTVDLHHTLPQVGVSADRVWSALDAHGATITVVGAPVPTLDRTASALVIALHAAHHGPRWNRARLDLERACDVLDRDCWDAAALLARELRAEPALGFGLGTAVAGCALARQLGLRTKPTPAHRVMWSATAWQDRRRARSRRGPEH